MDFDKCTVSCVHHIVMLVPSPSCKDGEFKSKHKAFQKSKLHINVEMRT